jgi:hypothetical protein
MPGAREEVVILRAPAFTVSDSAAVSDLFPRSVAFTVKFEGPADKGIPVMRPVGERAKPRGREPAVTSQTYGGVPPVAFSVCE